MIHVMHVPDPAFPERGLIVQSQAALIAAAGYPPLCVHPDPDRLGVLSTYRSAILCAASDAGAEWSLVIQDDAIPLPGWDRHLPDALAFSPTPILGLSHFRYYGQSLVKGNSRRPPAPYGTAVHATWGQAVAYRADVLTTGGYAQFVDDIHSLSTASPDQPYRKWDDGIAAAFNIYTGHGSLSAITSRALFDHAQGRSLLGHGGLPRRPRSTILSPGPWYDAPPPKGGWPPIGTKARDEHYRLAQDVARWRKEAR